MNPIKWFKRWRAQRGIMRIVNRLCPGCGRIGQTLGRTTVTAPLCVFTVKICEPCYFKLKHLETRGGPEYVDLIGRMIQWRDL